MERTITLLVCLVWVGPGAAHELETTRAPRLCTTDHKSLEDIVLKLSTDLNDIQVQLAAEKNNVLKLSTDLNDMQVRLATEQAEVSRLREQVDVNSRKSAFLATYSHMKPATPSSGPFPFDKAVFNIGGNYDPLLGVFTAPYKGVYSFSADIYGRGAQGHILFDLVVNGSFLSRTISQGALGGDSSVVMSINAHLEAGDRVWIQGVLNSVFNLWGTNHAFFTGTLIFAD